MCTICTAFCSSVQLDSGSCDNLKIIKVRCIKRGVSISSNYTSTDFDLKFIINGNKQERMISKELFEGPVGTVLPTILSNACLKLAQFNFHCDECFFSEIRWVIIMKLTQ